MSYKKSYLILGALTALLLAAFLPVLLMPSVKSGVNVSDKNIIPIVLGEARTHFDNSFQRVLAFRYQIIEHEKTDTYDRYRVVGKTFFDIAIQTADVFSNGSTVTVPSLRDDIVVSPNNVSNTENHTNVPVPTNNEAANFNNNAVSVPETKEFIAPIDRAKERVTKKPFGIYITPASSPVQPEKFTGYHTGTDFEIFPGEENIDVPVHASCNGSVRIRQYVNGYGGVLIHDCAVNGQKVTVLYGHLNLESITVGVGDELVQGQVIGNLGQGYSSQTDGERKHLHLSVHRGTGIEYKGYVSTEGALSSWIDAETLM